MATACALVLLVLPARPQASRDGWARFDGPAALTAAPLGLDIAVEGRGESIEDGRSDLLVRTGDSRGPGRGLSR